MIQLFQFLTLSPFPCLSYYKNSWNMFLLCYRFRFKTSRNFHIQRLPRTILPEDARSQYHSCDIFCHYIVDSLIDLYDIVWNYAAGVKRVFLSTLNSFKRAWNTETIARLWNVSEIKFRTLRFWRYLGRIIESDPCRSRRRLWQLWRPYLVIG